MTDPIPCSDHSLDVADARTGNDDCPIVRLGPGEIVATTDELRQLRDLKASRARFLGVTDTLISDAWALAYSTMMPNSRREVAERLYRNVVELRASNPRQSMIQCSYEDGSWSYHATEAIDRLDARLQAVEHLLRQKDA